MIYLYFLVRESWQAQMLHTCECSLQAGFTWGETRPYPGRVHKEGKIRIGLEYVSTWGYSSQSPIGISLRSGTAQLKGFLQSILSVSQEQIKTSATTCTPDTIIPETVRNTYLDYDLYIFVNSVSSGISYAYGNACVLKSTSPQRSIFGSIGWNTQQVTNAATTARGYQLNIRVGMHLFIHVLGFASQLFQYWVQARRTQTVGAVTYIVTSSVKAQVKAYFGCSSLGMPLEDQNFGSSHWQKDVLKDELMTNSFYYEDYMFISRITLAALLDTGWYTSVAFQYAQSQYMQFGRGRGCSFLSTRNCSISPQFCSAQGLVYYQQSYGFCSSDSFSSCMLRIAYSGTDCRDPGYIGIYGGLQNTLETPGQKSMAFIASIVKLGFYPQAGYRCYESVCNPSGSALTVKIGAKYYTCSSGGQIISDIIYFAGSLTCPIDIKKFCTSRLTCDNNCDSQRMCVKSQCYGMSNNRCLNQQYISSGSCINCPPSCATCSSGSVCTTCAAGYNPVSGSLCIQCPSGSSYNAETQRCVCFTTSYGTPPSCINCPASCATCSSGSVCTTCAAGYNPVSGSLCIQCPSGSSYNAETQRCVCGLNQFGTPPSCTLCHYSCATCITLTACSSCTPTYNWRSGSVCFQCPTNSQYYTRTQTCICLKGYYRNEEICAQCVTGCASCFSAGNCSSCRDGFVINNNKCYYEIA